MSHSLLSPTDLSITDIENIFMRADEITNGTLLDLKNKRVTLALFNTAFPLPVQVEKILGEANAQVNLISNNANLGEIAKQANAFNADVILFSHPQSDSARELAGNTRAAVLNAGDGTHENPVRALIDVYTIRSLKGDFKKIRIALLGNLKFSAEAHSLARTLGVFETRLSFVTPAALSMPYDLTDEVRLTAYEVEETNDLATTLRKTDVLYLVKIDPIRVEKKIYDKLNNFYALMPETFAEAKDGLVVLGEWENAKALLSPTRPQVERAARAILLTLIEYATM
ncbi:MAG TPA: hypothetical protein VFD70_03520 [Anaerolineae bacterium]|nr:hypothetical protein [Anaerolineae bacterium]